MFRIQGKEHMWIFGKVNGHLVSFDAVLEDSLGGDTELVLGSAALQQLNAVRRKAAGSDCSVGARIGVVQAN